MMPLVMLQQEGKPLVLNVVRWAEQQLVNDRSDIDNHFLEVKLFVFCNNSN